MKVTVKWLIALENFTDAVPERRSCSSIVGMPVPLFSQMTRSLSGSCTSWSKADRTGLRDEVTPSVPSSPSATGPNRPPGFRTTSRLGYISTWTCAPRDGGE